MLAGMKRANYIKPLKSKKLYIMEHLKSILKSSIAIMVLSLVFTSCSKDEAVDMEEQQLDTTEVTQLAEIDEASESLTDIVIDVYESDPSDSSRTATRPGGLPDCVTITVVLEQGYREVTIDFGTEGCVVRGNTLKGKIIMSYTRDPEAQEVMISYSLEDFYFNNKNILGSKTLLKEKSNENGNPQFTHTLDLTVIWPNGVEASREGMKIKEWVEGYSSGIWSDNVFEITGNWTSTFRNGNTHTYEVIIPLRREVICTYFVSGSIDVQRTNFGGVFDFGDGDCDNQATFTFNDGTVREITLN